MQIKILYYEVNLPWHIYLEINIVQQYAYAIFQLLYCIWWIGQPFKYRTEKVWYSDPHNVVLTLVNLSPSVPWFSNFFPEIFLLVFDRPKESTKRVGSKRWDGHQDNTIERAEKRALPDNFTRCVIFPPLDFPASGTLVSMLGPRQ